MKITDLTIAPESLGNKFWLVNVVPAYEYKDNQRTDKVIAHKYSVCLPERGLEKIYVKIDGGKLLDAPESGFVEVSFTGLEVFIYWLSGQPQVGAKATGISLVNKKP